MRQHIANVLFLLLAAAEVWFLWAACGIGEEVKRMLEQRAKKSCRRRLPAHMQVPTDEWGMISINDRDKILIDHMTNAEDYRNWLKSIDRYDGITYCDLYLLSIYLGYES